MTWLVTGGAGYLGAHVVRAFLAADVRLTVLDDLSSGRLDFIPSHVSFTRGTVLDGTVLERVCDEHDVTGVVHLAGSTDDAGSVRRPLHAYEQNVDATTVLLATMHDRGVGRMVFASSLAVHGDASPEVLDESAIPAPTTPFGETKLVGEWLLRDQERAVGLRSTALRLPELVGTSDPVVTDPRAHAPFAAAFAAIEAGTTPESPALTRDYAHPADVARAILAAVRRLDAGETLAPVYDLGGGAGSTPADVAAALEKATGTGVPAALEAPRLVASGAAAARDLDWGMRHLLATQVAESWAARQATATA